MKIVNENYKNINIKKENFDNKKEESKTKDQNEIIENKIKINTKVNEVKQNQKIE